MVTRKMRLVSDDSKFKFSLLLFMLSSAFPVLDFSTFIVVNVGGRAPVMKTEDFIASNVVFSIPDTFLVDTHLIM